MHARPPRTLALLAVVLAAGCAGETHNFLSEHVLPVAPDGHLGRFAFDDPTPAGEPGPRRGRDLDEHVAILLDRAEAFADARAESGRADVVPLLVHLHGGRRTRARSAEQSDELLTVMLRDADERTGDTDWYPVFVHWRSGDVDTTVDRLAALRQGREVGGLWATVTLPFVLVQDLARGVIRLPKSLLYQWLRDAGVATCVATGWSGFRTWQDTRAITLAMTAEDVPTEERFDVNVPTYRRSHWAHAGRLVAYAPTQLIKVPVQGAFLEGLGQGAWDEMRRRAHHVVWLPETFEARRKGMSAEEARASVLPHEANGALGRLFHAIATRERPYRLMLVAHSMGAIAMNEGMHALAHHVDTAGGRLRVERIVYMAPACRVIDAANALVPFLEASRDTHFHLLALHPIAEADEINLYDVVVPRGSLLEWIDNYYTNPATHSERVFGKWSNAIPALGLFASVREQVHFKAFSVEPGGIPTKHGHFNRIPFWRPDAYRTDGESSYPADWLGRECRACLEQAARDGGREMRW